MTAPLGLGNRHLRLPLIFLIAILSWAPYLVTARSAQQLPLALSVEQETKLHLAPLLSGGASLSFPRDSSWGELTARVAAPRVAPQFFAVVEVATEADVEHTVSCSSQACRRMLLVKRRAAPDMTYA